MSGVNNLEIRSHVMRSGLHIAVGVPIVLLAVVLILHHSFDFLARPLVSGDNAKLVQYALIAVALLDALAAFLFKRRFINARALQLRYVFRKGDFAQQLAAAYMPVFAICAMPAVYGMVGFFLIGDVDTYVLMTVICPAAYMLIKPREEEIERLWDEIFAPTDDGDIRL